MDTLSKKAENLILHFACKEMLSLGKKKLAKLLYFVDFTNYELSGSSVTNLKYEKWQYGPVPAEFYGLLSNLKDKGVIDIKEPTQKYMATKIMAKKVPDYTVFSPEELNVINSITDRFKSSTAAQIEAVAKQEPPYKMVKDGEPIPYHLAYYRNSFEEMTLDENTHTSRSK